MRIDFTPSVSRGIGKSSARAKSVVFALARNYQNSDFGTRERLLKIVGAGNVISSGARQEPNGVKRRRRAQSRNLLKNAVIAVFFRRRQ